MSNVQIFIDITDADTDLNSEELEKLTASVKQEIQGIAEDVESVRESELPDGGKPALAAFVPGIVKTVLNPQKIKELVDTLGNRFYGKTVKLEYEDNGTKYAIEYGNAKQLDEAISGIERLAKIKISVTK